MFLFFVVLSFAIASSHGYDVAQQHGHRPTYSLTDVVSLLLHSLQADQLSAANSSFVDCAADIEILSTSQQTLALPGNTALNLSAIILALDAAGKPPAGILQGATEFRGNLEECKMINVPMNHSSAMSYGYLTLVIMSSATKQPVFSPFREVLCVPTSCNASAMEYVLQLLNQTIETRLGLYLDPSLTSYLSFSLDPPGLTTGAIVMIIVCCMIALLVVVSTFVDGLLCDGPLLHDCFNKQKLQQQNQSMQDAEANYKYEEKRPLLKEPLRNPSVLYELMTAFSLYKNIPMILSTRQPPSAITSINGVRVISMFWVIMCHVFTLTGAMFPALRNVAQVIMDVIPRFTSQVIINGFLSVDSFFFLSGVLVSYLTLREMKRRNGKFPLVPYYLHRILRLTPTYMFFLLFYWFIAMYLSQGPPMFQLIAGPDGKQQSNCRAYWWTNLLYINNLYPSSLSEECMSWSWYLANDMQFFVISPLIIVPLYVWFTGGLIASSVLLLVSFAVTGFLVGFYNFPASSYLPWGVPSTSPNYETEIYVKPYCRIGPYIIGLVLGAVFYYEYKPKLSKLANRMIYLSLWLAGIAIGMSAVYGLYGGFQGRVLTATENILYNMFSRTGWGVALAIVLFACHHGYGGPINSFLSMPFWIPLSRLTYTAYLVHPIVLTIIVGSQRDTIYYTDITIAVYIVGCTVISYAVAAILSTAV